MLPQTTRLAILGTGRMAQLAHLPCFAAVPDCEIAALASHRRLLATALAERYSIRTVYADYAGVLEDAGVDAIVCIQPFHNHYWLARQILEAGKSLFTEKPMATRLDDGQALADLAERRGLTYGVGFMKRFDPGVQLAREHIRALVQSGELGELQLVDAHCYLGNWLQNAGSPINMDEPASYAQIERRYPDHIPAHRTSAYDYFIDVFSHNLNLIRYLLPDERLECLTAVATGDETWAVTLASGDVLVTLRGARSASDQWEETTEFVFKHGKMMIRTPAPMNRQAVAKVNLYARQGDIYVENLLHANIEWAFMRQARGFVEALQGKAPFLAPARDCLRDLEIVEHIFKIAQFAGRNTSS